MGRSSWTLFLWLRTLICFLILRRKNVYLCCLCNDTNADLKCLLVNYNCLIHVHLKQGCMFMQMMLCTCLSSITLDATAKWRFFVLRPRTHSCTLKQLPTHCSTGTDSILSINCNTTIDLWWLCPFILASNLSSSVNDIVAIGPENFYATNDRFYPRYPQPGCTPPGSPLVWCHLLQPCRCEGGGYWLYVCKWYQHITWQKVFNVLSPQTRTFSDLCSSHELGGSSLHRYIYVSDIADHDIDVFERQDGEHLVFLEVMNLIS